jgi:predicted aspartyl protease
VGTFFYPMTLNGFDGRSVTLEALVDSGATFSSVPQQVLHELGIQPGRQIRLRLADRASHLQSLGEARVTIDGEDVVSLLVFGETNSPPAIGAYTLEGLLLGIDPVEKKLVRVEGWQASHV